MTPPDSTPTAASAAPPTARGGTRSDDTRVASEGMPSPIDVATRAFDAGLVVEPTSRAGLSGLDLTAGERRLVVAEVVTRLERLPLDAAALGDGCAERRVRGARAADDAASRDAERARAVREAAALKRELERLDG